jgi:hypothetical protein
MLEILARVRQNSQELVDRACNPHYLGNCDQKDPGPPISKITRAKWTGGVAQVMLCLYYDCKWENIFARYSSDRE